MSTAFPSAAVHPYSFLSHSCSSGMSLLKRRGEREGERKRKRKKENRRRRCRDHPSFFYSRAAPPVIGEEMGKEKTLGKKKGKERKGGAPLLFSRSREKKGEGPSREYLGVEGKGERKKLRKYMIPRRRREGRPRLSLLIYTIFLPPQYSEDRVLKERGKGRKSRLSLFSRPNRRKRRGKRRSCRSDRLVSFL